MKQIQLGTAILLCLGWAACTWAAGDAAICVLGGLTRTATVEPGGKHEGRIIVQNVGEQAQEIRVYQSDYAFTADGKTDYADAGTLPRSNAKWITYTPKQFTLGGGQSISVYYTIQVPKEQPLIGTYWSVLMVEPVATGSLEMPKAKPGDIRIGIRRVMRFAIQMVTNIGDTGQYSLKFQDRQLLADKDHRLLQIDIYNNGERWVTPTVWVELYDDAGVSLGRFEGGRMRLYPECSGRFKIDLTQVPPGTFTALLVADNGDDHVFGTRFTLECK